MARKNRDLLIVAAVYFAAAAVAILVYLVCSNLHPLVAIAIADAAATAVVFLFSLLLDNSSVYDPYWSVAPVPIAIAYAGASMHRLSFTEILVMLLVGLWALRLTLNWMGRWDGMGHEDWRYRDFRDRMGSLYWVVSFAGIHLFPTVVVYLSTMPLFYAFQGGTTGLLSWVAVLVVLCAVLLEAVADRQMNRFLDSRVDTGEIYSGGVWGVIRHPNYLGEMLFWWGIWLFSVSVQSDAMWTILGPAVVTLMFLLVSIPMIEKRMRVRRTNYAEYRTRVPMLIPWPTRRRRDLEG